LNHATKKILTTDNISNKYHLSERIVTLPTQKKNEMSPKWQESHSIEEKTGMYSKNDNEKSREEQILDMLKKVEKQKRLLLQEFGSSLPDDIFNVSIKPLLDERVSKTPQIANPVKSSSPEVEVINMSSSDEYVKKGYKDKKLKLPVKKSEIAIQTTLNKIAEDKGVQVDLSEQNINVSNPIDKTTKIPHPIEPKIIIVSPKVNDNNINSNDISSNDNSSNDNSSNDNSSNDSTSSEISGLIIEIDKKEVTVTPKKKKNTKLPKRLSPQVYQKIRSTSICPIATSSLKKFPKFQKKTYTDSNNRIDIQQIPMNNSNSAINDQTDPLQETRISTDNNTENSQTISCTKKNSSKPYRIRTQTKKWIRIKDTSDASTTFASPPPVRPKAIFDDYVTNVTPILEMLDVSEPEELRRLRQSISPVSTPETPSPRTMAIPSNIPHREKITRILKYNLTDPQTNDHIMLSSTRIDESINQPMNCQSDSREDILCTSPLESSTSCRVCTCKNPTCKLLHTKLDDIHDYALKNCPEILQKYEDLQNLCTERIASLTDLIEKVRSEQKGKN